MKNIKWPYLICLTGVIAGLLGLFACSLSDEDFSDIRTIEQIIRKDKEQIYGVELANDEKPLPEDSTILVAQSLYSIFGTPVKVEGYVQNATGILFGRVISNLTKSVVVNRVNDTLASAQVTYLLEGNLKIIQPFWTRVKSFRHPVTRYMTFVKRVNPVTQDPWSLTSISAAYGISDLAGISVDSLRIVTPRDTIETDHPFNILFTRNTIPVMRYGEWVKVELMASSSIHPNDTLAVYVIKGRNRNRAEYRQRRILFPNGTHRYTQLLYIDSRQLSGYNQLMIDLYDRNTFRKIQEPYRSAIVFIPFRIQEEAR